MATVKVRKLLQGIISVGIIWATLAALGVLAIVVSALPAGSFQQEASDSAVAVQEPPQVPGAKSALSAGAMGLPEVAPLNAVDPPTVNGLFYGDGDDSRYNLYAENPGRSALYYYLDGTTLYAALVISSSVNDNVFGVKKCNPPASAPDKDYLASAGWCPGPAHDVNDLIASDHSVWVFACGGISWTWQQDYAHDADDDLDASEADWISDPFCTPGPRCAAAGTPPPGFITSASSLQWNLNHHAPATSTWDVTLGGNRAYSGWKSPDDQEWPVSDNDVTDEGWPTYDTVHDWEWAMVYEASMDISHCSGAPFTLWPVSGHNSPSKDGEENVPLYDWGDNPDTGVGTGVGNYQTLNSDGGPSHQIVLDLYMGSIVDPESDGQPGAGANNDDNTPPEFADDEDGVLVADLSLAPLGADTVRVTATNLTGSAAVLWGFIDFDANGYFTNTGESATVAVPNGSTNVQFTLAFTVPVGAASSTYARFRLSTDTQAAALPTGPASDGEVEDYLVQIGEETPTPTPTPTETSTPTPTTTETRLPGIIEAIKYRPHGEICATWNFWYYIHITNTTDAVVHSIVVTDTLPAGIAPWSVQVSPGGVFDGVDTVVWHLGNLGSYGSIHLWIKAQTYSSAVGACITNRAWINAQELDVPVLVTDTACVRDCRTPTSTATATATQTATATPTSSPTATATQTSTPTASPTPVGELSLSKFRPHGDVVATYTFWYYIYVHNGTNETLTNVVVTDVLPEGIAPYSVRVSDGGAFDGESTVTWELDSLDPGEGMYLWICANTYTWAAGMTLSNVAMVEADGVLPVYAYDQALVYWPPEPTATPTGTPTATRTPTSTSTAPPTATQTPTPTLTPVYTSTPSPTGTITVVPTATETRTATPTPTATSVGPQVIYNLYLSTVKVDVP